MSLGTLSFRFSSRIGTAAGQRLSVIPVTDSVGSFRRRAGSSMLDSQKTFARRRGTNSWYSSDSQFQGLFAPSCFWPVVARIWAFIFNRAVAAWRPDWAAQ